MGYSLSTMLDSNKEVSYKTEILSGLTVVVAIVAVSALVIFLRIPTTTVADTLNPGQTIRGSFPPFGIPQIPFNGETLMLILPYATILAGVGLIESLLTLNLIDEVTETRGNGNRE